MIDLNLSLVTTQCPHGARPSGSPRLGFPILGVFRSVRSNEPTILCLEARCGCQRALKEIILGRYC